MTRNEISEAISVLATAVEWEGPDRVLINQLEDKFKGGKLSIYMTGKLKKLKLKYIQFWEGA
tara:strand:+ start:1052 stop:1237 length:186 start_codon:yes stop_codon:yes gene_type:complete